MNHFVCVYPQTHIGSGYDEQGGVIMETSLKVSCLSNHQEKGCTYSSFLSAPSSVFKKKGTFHLT